MEDAFRVADAARGRALTERLGAEARSLPAATRRDVAELRDLLARIEVLTARLRATDSARTRERGGTGAFVDSTLTRQLADARREFESLTRARCAAGARRARSSARRPWTCARCSGRSHRTKRCWSSSRSAIGS